MLAPVRGIMHVQCHPNGHLAVLAERPPIVIIVGEAIWRPIFLLGQMLNQLRRGGTAQRRIAVAQRNQLIVAQLVELFGQVEVQRDGLRSLADPAV